MKELMDRLFELHASGHEIMFDGEFWDAPFVNKNECGLIDYGGAKQCFGRNVSEIKSRLKVFKEAKL